MDSNSSTGKILLVEDDLFLRDIYVEILQKDGFTVITADDGEAGVALGQNHPDAKIMLLDIMLPKMHGIDVLKQLKANPATQKIPVVMLTNLTEEHVIQEALHSGAAGFLVKVRYTPPEVVTKVKEFIKFQEQHQIQQVQPTPPPDQNTNTQ
ncbi:MAG TPA: response regulator [Methylomirabilota bacterium]|nr:response regulator [Methylomirabilota bacterium]